MSMDNDIEMFEEQPDGNCSVSFDVDSQITSESSELMEIPKTPEQWQEQFVLAEVVSNKRCLEFNFHRRMWDILITTVGILDNPVESYLKCAAISIDTMPVTRDISPTSCMDVLEDLLDKITKGEIKDSDALPIIEKSKIKFGLSYSKAQHFWSIFRKYKRQMLKVREAGESEILEEMHRLYMEQFSYPYLKMDQDYNEYKTWCKINKIPKEKTFDIQKLVYKNQELLAINLHPDEQVETSHHHVSLEIYIDNFKVKNQMYLCVLCEEHIMQDPKNACFYLIYLRVLDKLEDKALEDRHQRIKDVTLRGLKNAQSSCEGMLSCLIESSLLISSKHLTLDDVSEIINIIPELFLIEALNEETSEIWFESRKGMLTAYFNCISQGNSDVQVNGLYSVLKAALAPLGVPSYYVDGDASSVGLLNEKLKMKIFEVLRVYLILQMKLSGDFYTDVINNWIATYQESTDSVFLIGFLLFTKEFGSPIQLEEVFGICLLKLFEQLREEKEDTASRKIYVHLLNSYRDFVLVNKDINSQMEISERLQKVRNILHSKHGEKFELQGSIEVLHQASNLNYSMPRLDQSESSIQEDNSITKNKDIASTRASTYSGKTFKPQFAEPLYPGRDAEEFPLFAHNLPYKATEQDIKDALESMNIPVDRVELKLEGRKSLGRGVIYLLTKEAQEKLEGMKTLEIHNRLCYVAQYYSDKKSALQKKLESTVLVLSDISEAWMDVEKIRSVFSPFGHISSVIRDEKDPNYMKVEFVMASDCENAYQQWLDGKVLSGEVGTVRKGFAKSVGKKRKLKSASTSSTSYKARKLNGHQNPPKEFTRLEPKKEKLPFNMVPTTVMKNADSARRGQVPRKRIDEILTSPSDNSVSVSSMVPSVAADDSKDSEPSTSIQPKTNEDFRKLFISR